MLADIGWAHSCFCRVRGFARLAWLRPSPLHMSTLCFSHIMFTNVPLVEPVFWPSPGLEVRAITVPGVRGPSSHLAKGKGPGRSVELGQ